MTFEKFKQLLIEEKDEEAVKQLKENYGVELLIHCKAQMINYSVTNRSPKDIENLVAEAIGDFWITVQRNPNNTINNMLFYIKRIISNKCKGKKKGNLSFLEIEKAEGKSNGFEKDFVNKDLIEKVFGRLTDKEKEHVLAHKIQGYSHKELSEKYGITEASSKAMVSRGMRKVKKILNPQKNNSSTS